MRYYKNTVENIVISINTMNGDGDGNLTQEEYESLLTMIRQTPEGKCVFDYGDGTYSYADAPIPPDTEPTDAEKAEAYDILIGGAT